MLNLTKLQDAIDLARNATPRQKAIQRYHDPKCFSYAENALYDLLEECSKYIGRCDLCDCTHDITFGLYSAPPLIRFYESTGEVFDWEDDPMPNLMCFTCICFVTFSMDRKSAIERVIDLRKRKEAIKNNLEVLLNDNN